MLTSIPDLTRQLVADRHVHLAVGAQPRRVTEPTPRSQAPPHRKRWWAVTRIIADRT